MHGTVANWLTHSEWTALGWTLLHFCWQGAAIAMVFAAADKLMLKAASAVRYAVALVALMLMPICAIVTFANELESATAIAAPAVTGPAAAMGLPVIGGTSGTSRTSETSATVGEFPESSRPNHSSHLAARIETALPWIDGAWILGMLLIALRAAGGWWQLERLRRSATVLVPASLQYSFRQMCIQTQVCRDVTLRLSAEIISPLAMGLWRATVLLPVSAVMQLSPEELEAVLAHELGHIRRWDYLCNLLQTAMECVLFFHPAVWWLSSVVRERREVCCDEIAVESCSDPIVYARALLRLEEQRTNDIRLAVALKGCSGTLLGRVRKVLGEEGPMESRITSSVRVAIATAVVLALTIGPHMRDAVAATQPIVNHVAALLPVAPAAVAASPVITERQTPAPVPVAITVAPEIPAVTEPDPAPAPEPAPEPAAQDASTPGHKGSSYIDGMREAGYPLDLNNDLDSLVSMKAVGVTPEYARKMAALGYGKPTLQQLISMRSLGVTPEYISALKTSGYGPKDFEQAVSEKALGITPEYSAEMKKAGFTDIDVDGLISLKAQGVSPEYVNWFKHEFPQGTMDELRQAAVFHLDEKFITEARGHGFDGKNLEKLLRLKISGLLD